MAVCWLPVGYLWLPLRDLETNRDKPRSSNKGRFKKNLPKLRKRNKKKYRLKVKNTAVCVAG